EAARAGQGSLDLAPGDHDAPEGIPDHDPLGGGRQRGMESIAPPPDSEHGGERGKVRVMVPDKVGTDGDAAENEHPSGSPGGPVRPPDPLSVAPLAHRHSAVWWIDHGRSPSLAHGRHSPRGTGVSLLPE